MDYLLETVDLTKDFSSQRVVDQLCLHIKKGEIYGFLGENGAGKTTTIRMLMGLLNPTSGSIYFNGQEFSTQYPSVLKNIGTIIEYPGFYPNLNARDQLKISSNLMGVKDEKNIDQVLNTVDLLKCKNKKVKDFSLGMKQRLGIARAILHNPEFLILDEPTNGLDPTGIQEIRELLLHLSQDLGKTILISSHILSEIEQLADTIGIIHQGVLVVEDNLNNLKSNFKKQVRLKVDNREKTIQLLREKIPNITYELVNENNLLILSEIPNEALITKLLVLNQIEVYEITTIRQSLEDYFINITGGGTIG
ncbi:ABC transporter ATP-binding protein [Lysinibacillus sp. NPDC097231]|uniref:ABC transporter ATP-binding protein n=1 Tax=Lysinibacillus sp. NPDC097231 TaxID=3364142 RepID=UPI00381EC624